MSSRISTISLVRRDRTWLMCAVWLSLWKWMSYIDGSKWKGDVVKYHIKSLIYALSTHTEIIACIYLSIYPSYTSIISIYPSINLTLVNTSSLSAVSSPIRPRKISSRFEVVALITRVNAAYKQKRWWIWDRWWVRRDMMWIDVSWES